MESKRPNRMNDHSAKLLVIFCCSDLLSNLSCAVQDHRGNSSILIGPRASGKSTLVRQLTEKLTLEHGKTHQIEHLTLQGAIFSETQSVLKFLLAKFKAIVDGASEIEDEPAEDLSEYVSTAI